VKKFVKLLTIGMLVLGLAFAAIGCGEQEKESKTTGTDGERPVLNVASETTYPPMEFTEGGEYVGFDMDLIRAIGEAEGFDVKIISLGFDALIPSVQVGTADCCISSMTITDERAEAIDFSDPYYTAGLIIAVGKDTEGISTLDDLQGKRLAAEVGTTGLAASNKIREKDPKTTVKVFDSVGEAFMELEKGSVDAVINDMPITHYYIKTTGKGKVKMVGEVFAAEDQYGIGVKKGNTELLEKINSGLQKIKDNGEYDKINEKWFGDEV